MDQFRSLFTVSFVRSEEHTSELQSQSNLVCRLLLEKKKKSRLTKFAEAMSRTRPGALSMMVKLRGRSTRSTSDSVRSLMVVAPTSAHAVAYSCVAH